MLYSRITFSKALNRKINATIRTGTVKKVGGFKLLTIIMLKRIILTIFQVIDVFSGIVKTH